MIRGCFTNIFAAVGCATVLCLGAVGAWIFREDIAEVYRAIVEHRGETGPSVPMTGRTSAAALEAALQKEATISRDDGPESVTLTADEIASLIAARLPADARQALDSIRISISEDRFTLEASLETEAFGRDLLGPLRGMIDPREPVLIAGPARVQAPGVIGWDVDQFKVASFPFPGPTIPVLVNRLTGGTGGMMLFAVPTEVGSLQIRPDGVTFYRRAQ